MSLLMDALRKAEADKKQASTVSPDAESDQETTNPSLDDPTREFRVPDYTELAATVAPAGGSPPSETPLEPAGAGLELSLEPLETDAGSAAGISSLDETMAAGVEPQTERTFGGSPSSAAPARVAAAIGSGSGIQETVATAQTVFDAGAGGPSKRVIVWGVAVVLFVGCVMTGVGFYYFRQAPTTHEIPSPSVALNVERSAPKELPVVGMESAPKAPPTAVVRIEPRAAAAAEDGSGVRQSSATEAAVAEAPPTEPVALMAQAMSPADEQAPAPQHMAADPVMPNVPPAPQIGVRPGAVRIARSERAGDSHARLKQAYTAYVGGEYARAEELYRRILSQRPEQRDATLGLAALQLRAGEVATAHRLYREVLKREPGNPTASAALFSIEGGAGEQVTESRLKMLLDDGVDAGYIYFSLGNLYARHGRWPDAQQAYFEALRHNPGNPDYNYNLAVSLDRIGQRKAAVKYYDAAVNLTDAGQAGFDTALALARIQAINSAGSR